ncbi:MAG TPA: glycosyltransferase N-terminal domain-containing protein [candidate division Zixibacteria bacterium]|nr:glycosyltransferase N-terminal domain-containing protein [candidate division Zixibacteria bacterium]
MFALYKLFGWLLWLACLPVAGLAALLGNTKWRDRLGFVHAAPADIWLHASSVGEVRVIANLINWLLEHRPNLCLHITTMTETGQAEALRMFGDRATVSYIPGDTPPAVKIAMGRITPREMVIAETEIWPVLIDRLARKRIPVVLVNGRMTDRTLKKYLRARKSLARILGRYDRFFFKTKGDADRYAELGLPEGRWEISGDLKFDTPLPERDPQLRTTWRRKLSIPEEAFLLVAGSTRDGEEVQLLEMYGSLKNDHPQLRLIIAPRHVERGEMLRRLTAEAGFRVHLLDTAADGDEVIIVDKMGLLNDLYQVADLAFVGGTLSDIGGHNLLEPVWAGTPVIYGPSLHNVREAARYIENNRYGMRVNTSEELAETVKSVIMGTLSFRIKTSADLAESPTSRAGEYILGRLKDA